MIYLSALAAFFALHILPFNSLWRKKLTVRLGEPKYKALFRVAIIFIIAAGVYGWNDFPNYYFYEPPLIMKRIHMVIMFPVVLLWVLAEVPNNFRRYIRHPMLTGMKLWAIGHLLANGDLRSMTLFISFLIFSVIAVILTNKKTKKVEHKKAPIKNDILVLAASVTIYSLLFNFHANLFGMPITQYF